jgi:hypothetical protein
MSVISVALYLPLPPFFLPISPLPLVFFCTISYKNHRRFPSRFHRLLLTSHRSHHQSTWQLPKFLSFPPSWRMWKTSNGIESNQE